MPITLARQPHAAQLTFRVRGPVNGLVAWFSAEMPGAAELTNAPGSPGTHWGQFLFPVASAAVADSGAELQIGFHCVPSSAGGSHYLWSAQIGDSPLEIHDTRRVARPQTVPPWRVAAP